MKIAKMIFSDFLIIIKKLVGYKKSDDIKQAEKNILILLSRVNNLKQHELEEILKIYNDLSELVNYNDYNMFASTSNDNVKEVSNLYLNLLDIRDEKQYYLNEIELKTKINEGCINGDIDLIRLKAILVYLGNIYEKNENKSIEIFKTLGYIGDLISLKILPLIVSENEKEFYKELYSCVKEIYDSYVFNLNELNYKEKIINTCRIIFENKKKNIEQNKEMLAYIFLNVNDEINNIKCKIGKSFVKNKIGF